MNYLVLLNMTGKYNVYNAMHIFNICTRCFESLKFLVEHIITRIIYINVYVSHYIWYITVVTDMHIGSLNLYFVANIPKN